LATTHSTVFASKGKSGDNKSKVVVVAAETCTAISCSAPPHITNTNIVRVTSAEAIARQLYGATTTKEQNVVMGLDTYHFQIVCESDPLTKCRVTSHAEPRRFNGDDFNTRRSLANDAPQLGVDGNGQRARYAIDKYLSGGRTRKFDPVTVSVSPPTPEVGLTDLMIGVDVSTKRT
jgi:hypothetical protein